MIYFDNGATSRFKPQSLFDAMMLNLKNSSNPGRSGHSDAINCALKIYNTRETVKQFVKADDSYNVVFTSNCTEALNLAIFGFAKGIKERFDVVTTLNEHNSVLRPLFQLQMQGKINVVLVPPQSNGKINPQHIKNSITKNTKMVIVNHISNVTGAESDIFEIGKVLRGSGITFVVDGAQSLGHSQINMAEMNIDILCGAGHKGLHGPLGVGFAVFKQGVNLQPIKFGGTGTNSESVYQPIICPEAYESGTLNAPAIIGLNEGIIWTAENFQEIYKKVCYLSSEMVYGLRNMPHIKLYSNYPSGVVSFNVDNFASYEVSNFLDERGIATRSGLHCAPLIHKHLGTMNGGTVRASIGFCNDIEEVKVLLSSLEELK